MADGLGVAGVGVAFGVAGALLASRFLASLLFNTSPRDATVVVGVIIGVLLTAGMASLIPARRAARVNPLEALRSE